MQINSQPVDIIMYVFGSKMAICMGHGFDSYERTNQTVRELGLG